MKRIIEFINKYGMVIIVPLILIMFLKTCSTNGRVDGVTDEIEMTNQKVDTLKFEIQKEIRLEGLKSEKRMIQATDRKILDVQRQTQIEEEIKKLDK